MMKLPWQLKDYIFASVMTLGMVISALIIPWVTPRFLELIFWAPVGGIFLTLGMSRLEARGSVALMIIPVAIILSFLSFPIGLYLTLTALITEAVIFFRGNYHAKRNRFLGNVVFFTAALVIGYLTAAFFVGEEFATLIRQPLRLGGLIVAVGITGSLGWGLGEMILSRFTS